MKTIGVVGGMGPESTIDYYRLLIAAHREACPDGSLPRILIDSVDMQTVLALASARDLPRLSDYLAAALDQLARAGAEIGLLASNTPHMAFDELRRRSPIPLVSIVEATRDAAVARGLHRLGLFGARFTMQGDFYPTVFSEAGMELVVPTPEEQTYIHEKYMGELVAGIFRPETRDNLLAIAQRMQARDSIQALILGGTELPLLLRNVGDAGIPLLDTARIHVQAVMAQAAA